MTSWDDDEYRWRAAKLAVIRFTEREDLDVTEAARTKTTAQGDLDVRLRGGGSDHDLRFEVVTKAPLRASQWSAIDDRGALVLDDAHASVVREMAERARDAQVPVMLAVFAMEGDAGWFTWLHGVSDVPSVMATPGASHDRLLPLNRGALDPILETVRAWYAHRAKAA